MMEYEHYRSLYMTTDEREETEETETEETETAT